MGNLSINRMFLSDNTVVFYPYRKGLIQGIFMTYTPEDLQEYIHFQKVLSKKATQRLVDGEIVNIIPGTVSPDNHTCFQIGPFAIGFEDRKILIGTSVEIQ